MTKILISSDHAGYAMKEEIKDRLSDGYEWIDLGTHSGQSVDYPDFGHAMAKALGKGTDNKGADKGVLICGSGVGISIAANRHEHVRAALCADATVARLAREHNDANVLALGSRIIGIEVAAECVKAFVNTAFEGGRHQGRVEKLKVEA